MDQVKNIPIQEIVKPQALMRLVDTGSLDYLELYYSIRDYGFLNSISVRPSKKQKGKYELIEGLWRLTVAVDLKLETIPCIIKDVDEDTTVLFLQIQANAIGAETKPCEYAAHLDRILKSDTEMTLVTLAGRLRKSVDWIRNTLSLNRLNTDIKKSVDRGEIPIKSARLLAKLPQHWQDQFAEQAKLLIYRDFSPIARKVIKDYKEEKRRGRMKSFYETQFEPHPFLRSMAKLLHEMEFCEEGALYLAVEDLKPIEIWKRAVQWVLNLDPKGVEAQKKRYQGMRKQGISDRKRREIDRKQRQELEENFGWDLTNSEK